MGKFVEVTLTEVLEIPEDWEIIQDDEGNMAIQINDNEYLDFETTMLYANIANVPEDEEAQWKACVDDETLDMLEEKGLREMKSELDIFPLDDDELNFDKDEDLEDQELE